MRTHALLLAVVLLPVTTAEVRPAAAPLAAASVTPGPPGATAAPAPAPAQSLTEAELDRRVADVASGLRCPVCRNQSVLESSSDLARRMQAVVRERLAAGETPEEVRAYFVSRYGDWILLQPEPEGINLLVYLLPAVVLLAGIVLVAVMLRRWTHPDAPAATPTAPEPGSRP